MKLSIVSPVYLAEGIVDELIQQIVSVVSKITSDFEIVLVEDGSPDRSWEKIYENCKKDSRIKGIKFSRNFGQHFAITAGLKYATGDYVVVIDCDLQDDPKNIPLLLNKAQEGFEIVYARKIARSHGFMKNFFANIFYKLFSLISDYKMDPTIGSFSIISRKVVNSFLDFKDYRRGYLVVLRWLGYKPAYIDVSHNQRYNGKSSYSLEKLLKLAEVIAVSYSDKLLRISIYLGILFSSTAILGIAYLVYRYIFTGVKEGWTSVMATIILVGGFIMVSLGVLGLYIGQIFEQVKNRPMFIVQDSLNCEEMERFIGIKDPCLQKI
jgi:dolichol-phosphate mannosyltransferase